MLRAGEHTTSHTKWSPMKTYIQKDDTDWAVSTCVFRHVTISEKRGHEFENDLFDKENSSNLFIRAILSV